MPVSIFEFVQTFAPMLKSLSDVLDKGAAHAKAKGFDPKILVEARLAPDMYPLWRQIEIACDTALTALALLQGRDPAKQGEIERNFDGLKARIEYTLEQLAAVRPADLEASGTRTVTIPLPDMNAKFVFSGLEYLRDWSLPHFFFHVVTAYDILRHNGVEIGKRDYMSEVGRYIKAAG